MKALSIRAPWWWFILHGGKDIENRDWPTRFRGTVYVHASKWWSRNGISEYVVAIFEILERAGLKGTIGLHGDEWKRYGGHIVGTVDIVGCVTRSESPWFFGRYGFVLANPAAFATPIPCKGALLFFNVPADVQAAIDAANSNRGTVNSGERAA